MSYYQDYIIETYENKGEPSSKNIRAHPLPGQGVSISLNVECSAPMREKHAPHTLFKVNCKVTNREGSPFLYRHYSWSYQVISREIAEKFISENFKDHKH